MPLLINRERVDNDPWTRVDEETLATTDGDIIVPIALYREQRDALSARTGRIAVQVNGDDEIDDLLAEPNRFELIAIEFPTLRDGRGFSIARLLKRAGFNGQIRAVGDVTQDRLDYMMRCGFDALDISAERFSEEVFNAFTEMSVRYQGAADDQRPVYHQ